VHRREYTDNCKFDGSGLSGGLNISTFPVRGINLLHGGLQAAERGSGEPDEDVVRSFSDQ
jgi:hypothetical protein